jgi:hypothetical protein
MLTPLATARKLGPLACGGGGAASPLLAGLVSYWKLDETSGTRADSVGSNHLTDNNTVGYAAGKIGNAASFVQANNEYLSKSGLLLGGLSAFTVSGWLYVGAATTGDPATGAWNGRGWNMYMLSGTTPRFYCYGNGANDYVTWGSSIAKDNWLHYVVWWDGSKIGMSINNGAAVTTNHAVAPDDVGLVFNIGRTPDGGGYFTGMWDEFGIWSRALGSSEIASLYNAGSGETHPFS